MKDIIINFDPECAPIPSPTLSPQNAVGVMATFQISNLKPRVRFPDGVKQTKNKFKRPLQNNIIWKRLLLLVI